MAEHPNMRGYSFTWTQPYTSTNPFYQRAREQAVEAELSRLETLDHAVDQMTDYPDAARIIRSIQEKL